MNELNIKHNWSEKKKKLQSKFGDLSDNDLIYIEGKEDELIRRVQNRLGLNHYETRKLFVSLEMSKIN